ncbi:hypothetical protein QUB75_27080 [Microcoleus sp. K1-B6]|uniref:hypothetical protein n=1 Tax=unclassified Microcoleus TaxID=2642155 RepID=UPI002FD77E9E
MLDLTTSSKILKYCQSKNYPIETFNIIYIEGCDINGRLNSDAPNQFNDVRAIFDKTKCLDCWQATCEPGAWYTHTPMNPDGAFRIAFGFHKQAWEIGIHGNSEPHEALIQVGEVRGFRDYNQDFVRPGDREVRGHYGINQHWGYDMPPGNIGQASAGCLVGRSRHGHREFMQFCKNSGRRYFDTIVIPGNEVFKF